MAVLAYARHDHRQDAVLGARLYAPVLATLLLLEDSGSFSV